MKLDSGQLTAFSAVLREGSFEAASRRLHVTPSAISQRIRLLEERLGQVLVNRKNPSVPTAAGETLARLAMQVDLLEAEALRELGCAPVMADEPIRLPIVINGDSLASWFFATLDFLPMPEQIVFDIRVEDQDYSASLLRDGSVMAAVTNDPAPVQGCQVEPLGVMRYFAVASVGFIQRHFPDGVNEESLARAPILVFNEKDALQHQFLQEVTSRTLSPLQHRIPSVVCFFEMARRGLGWGMVPEMQAQAALESGEIQNLLPGRWLDIPLYWQHWRIRSAALEMLTAAIKRTAARHLRPWVPEHDISGN